MLGIAALAAFVAWGVLNVRSRIRTGLARVQAASIFMAPARITLKGLEPFKWTKGERAAQRVETFHALGFSDLGGYTLSESPDTRLFLLQHSANGQLGIVMERDAVGTWSDVALFEQEGQPPIYASSVLKKEHFFLLPGDPKIHLAGASETELVTAAARAADPSGSPTTLTAEDTARRLEAAYAAAVDARLLEPIEEYELRQLLRRFQCDDDDSMSDDAFQLIKEQLPFIVGNQLRAACRDHFTRSGGISAREWNESKARVLVIHDRMSLVDLGSSRLNQAAHCTPSLKKRLKSLTRKPGTPRNTFAEFNGSLPPWERYQKLGEVERPVPADIYAAPIRRQST